VWVLRAVPKITLFAGGSGAVALFEKIPFSSNGRRLIP